MLRLTDIRKTLDLKIHQGISYCTIKELLNGRDFDVDFDVYLPSKDKNLQRPLCWTLLQKQEIVMSVLIGREISNFSIIQHKSTNNILDKRTIMVIDGKQRLSSILSFCRNEFPINVDGLDYYFESLDEAAQRAILLFNVSADVAYSYWDKPVSDQTKVDWFCLINFAGTPQDVEHMTYITT